MTSRLALLPLIAAVLVVTGCAGRLGTGYPACDLAFSEVGTATIMQAQAVPDATFGPCVDELAPGWDLHNTEPEHGRAGFSIDSDRVGLGFLDVHLLDSCTPPEDAADGLPPGEGIDRLVEERRTTAPIEVTLVPVGSRHSAAAFAVGNELAASRVTGHRFSVRTAEPGTDPAERTRSALDAGRFVLVVDDELLTDGVLELRDPTDRDDVEIDDLPELIDEIGERAGQPVYEATWWHRFDGGCIVYDFDAEGPGADTVATRVHRSVGFYPLAELREAAAAEGLVYGELP